VGLLGTSDDEFWDWLSFLDDARWLGLAIFFAGLGVFALITGNTLGRLVGAGLLLFALIQGVSLYRRNFVELS
jgi:hypothetical protein